MFSDVGAAAEASCVAVLSASTMLDSQPRK
jgi:hypothetical protein